MLRPFRLITVCALLAAFPVAGFSMTLRQEYAKAATLGKLYRSLAVNIPGKAHWIGDTDSFWYRKTVAGGYAFVLVNATKQTRGPAFNQDKLAAAYNKASGASVKRLKLPFSDFTYTDGRKSIRFAAGKFRWKCSLEKYVCTKTGKNVQWWQEPKWASPENNPADRKAGRQAFADQNSANSSLPLSSTRVPVSSPGRIRCVPLAAWLPGDAFHFQTFEPATRGHPEFR